MKKKFLAYLSSKGAEETFPRILTLTTNPKGESIGVHSADKVTSSTPSDCYLQIWELDVTEREMSAASASGGIGLVEKDASMMEPPKNRLIATFPGLVVERTDRKAKKSSVSFQPTGANIAKTRATKTDELNGQITLKMTPVGKTEQDVVIAMPEYEGVFELASLLLGKTDPAKSSEDKRAVEEDEAVLNAIKPQFQRVIHRVFNVKASLLRQIKERGGFATSFVTDYKKSIEKNREIAKDLVPKAEKAILEAEKLNKEAEKKIKEAQQKIQEAEKKQSPLQIKGQKEKIVDRAKKIEQQKGAIEKLANEIKTQKKKLKIEAKAAEQAQPEKPKEKASAEDAMRLHDSAKKLQEDAEKSHGNAKSLSKKAANSLKKVTGNPEFASQAEAMIPTFPTFKLGADDKVKFGHHLISGWQNVGDNLKSLTAKIKTQFNLKETPTVAVIALYSHGEPNAMELEDGTKEDGTGDWRVKGVLRADDWVVKGGDRKDAKGRTERNDVEDFVKGISVYLSKNVVMPLFACNCGRSQYHPPEPDPAHPPRSNFVDTKYGVPLPCEENGVDSLGWRLYRELRQKGKNPTVWAHTTAGHTTMNSHLRVFSHWGIADFLNILVQAPRVHRSTKNTYISTGVYDVQGLPRVDYVRRLYNAEFIRNICMFSGKYLPWGWNGGTSGGEENDPLAKQATRLIEETRTRRKVGPKIGKTLPDEWKFENNRTYIVGLTKKVKDEIDKETKKKPRRVYLSENFEYRINGIDVLAKKGNFRLSVQLMKNVQLLHYRCVKWKKLPGNCNFVLKDLTVRISTYESPGNSPEKTEDGVSFKIEPEECDKKFRQTIVNVAKKMMDQGLFRRVEEKIGETTEEHAYEKGKTSYNLLNTPKEIKEIVGTCKGVKRTFTNNTDYKLTDKSIEWLGRGEHPDDGTKFTAKYAFAGLVCVTV